MRIGLRAPAMVLLLLLRGAAPHVDVLLVGQLLFRAMQATSCTGCSLLLVGLLGGLFEIILRLMQVLLVIIVLLLMVHVLFRVDLLCLVELLHVVLACIATAILVVVLQILVVVARVFSALRCLIINYVKITALLAGPVLELYFDLGNTILTSLGSLNRVPSFLIVRGRMVLWVMLLLILMMRGRLLLALMRSLTIASMEVDSICSLVIATTRLRLVRAALNHLGLVQE